MAQIPSYRFCDILRYGWAQPGLAKRQDAMGYVLNGVPISEEEYRRLTPSEKLCVFCKTRLKFVKSEKLEAAEPLALEPSLWRCPSCGFWTVSHGIGSTYGGYWRCCAGKLAEYPETASNVPLSELAHFLRLHPERIHDISPTALEKLIAECFRSTDDYADVVHVGRPDDGGIDVLLVTQERQKVLVQVKRRASEKVESVSTIRNLLGAMVPEGALQGIVVSTADHFSYRAETFVQSLATTGTAYRIELRDLGRVRLMVEDIPDPKPWLPYLSIPKGSDPPFY